MNYDERRLTGVSIMEREERQFEQEMSPEERQIQSMLSNALTSPSPEGLSERVAAVSQPMLLEACDEALEQQLASAFAVPSPHGLADRVYEASVDHLHEDGVIARIGPLEIWRQVALAASVVFAVFVAYQIAPETTTTPTVNSLVASNTVLSVEDEELLFEDLNLSEYAYLADARELAFADVAVDLAGLRNDIELWQYGLLSE
jgi:hypothetical protein